MALLGKRLLSLNWLNTEQFTTIDVHGAESTTFVQRGGKMAVDLRIDESYFKMLDSEFNPLTTISGIDLIPSGTFESFILFFKLGQYQ